MIVTKRALPRRTFLQGAGAMLGLPLLDAMVPSFTALAQSAAAPLTNATAIRMRLSRTNCTGIGLTRAPVSHQAPTKSCEL